MSTTNLAMTRLLPLKIIQPVAISAFTVFVLAASFLVGKHIGYEQGLQQAKALPAVSSTKTTSD